MMCPVCRASRMVEIEITLQGDAVRMRACSRCDTRWWERDGESIELEGVLEMAASPKK
jgi:Zn-finger nucleic acid-binding protein